MEANIIVLKKLKKGDYLELKSYKLIVLLDTLGKILEAVVSRRLSNIAEKYELLPL